ncbi:MAG: acylphosphatase [Betaproteobacteria bacterium]|nr:MAG: acylphosphatase [Betaproteobacteria bacterium]
MTEPSDHRTLHLSIAGRVQGVGYRESLRAEALRLCVRGWVRNRRDGTVEAVAQGPAEAVDALIAWARRGPPAARVAQIDVRPACGEADRPYAGFERLPSG